jgi:hypothetical protein
MALATVAVGVSATMAFASPAAAGPGNPGTTHTGNIGSVYFRYSYAYQWLNVGGSWDFGNAHLVMQSDGNLVIYKRGTSVAKWATGTNGKGAVQMKFQTDGNLVLYKSNGTTAVWASKTNGKCPSGDNASPVIALQDDSNFVIYCHYPIQSLHPEFVALWASHTNGI